MRRRAAALASACLAFACTSRGGRPEVPTAPGTMSLAAEFELAPGQAVQVGTERLRVEFERVASDSRCPVDVQCVWEGDAVVVVALSQPARPSVSLQLHTAGSLPGQGTYGRHRVRLVKLLPPPLSSAPVPAADYRATFVVEEGGGEGGPS